ncbi:MAG: hypothetical protein HKN48_01010 [Flavobacteriaceae bacterium]|nr:hypothetical protein [Flavobacteriaceae bacterium]
MKNSPPSLIINAELPSRDVGMSTEALKLNFEIGVQPRSPPSLIINAELRRAKVGHTGFEPVTSTLSR